MPVEMADPYSSLYQRVPWSQSKCSLPNTQFSLFTIWIEFSKSLNFASFLLNVSALKSFLSSHIRRSQAISLTLCLEIASVKYPVSLFASFIFHKTLEYEHHSAKFFANLQQRMAFPPLANNMFLISIWDLIKIALTTIWSCFYRQSVQDDLGVL